MFFQSSRYRLFIFAIGSIKRDAIDCFQRGVLNKPNPPGVFLHDAREQRHLRDHVIINHGRVIGHVHAPASPRWFRSVVFNHARPRHDESRG